MTPLAPFGAHWPELSALLDEALSLPGGDQAAWLAGLTGERAAHRDALAALLAHRAVVETDDFLVDGPKLGLVADASGTGLAPGAQIGAYRLLREIGRGGMGTVWLAERSDGLVKRPVALKLPRIVWGDTFAERMAREREILAGLEHDHIARLYDTGMDAQGRPFLAMEYVEGEPIDVYCRARELSTRERVALLLQVMAAVAHAHSRLVVHRDLKPNNILVTRDAQVKLLDFGIAKLLEGGLTHDTAITEVSGRALTPDYASPEQITGGPLGTPSDVYSVGVVAYELIAGGRPYRLKRGTPAELEEAIAAVEPPLASEVAGKRSLAGDLDAILHQALKKSPAARYPTMDAFAQDLRRWLAGEPVTARPDRVAYRMAKFVGRHRLQVAAGGAVVVALLVGTALALWQAREARLQAARAQTEAATAKAVQSFIESVFFANSGNQTDPAAARETTARELLDRGAERIERELKDAPEARLRLNKTMQEMYSNMALNDRAVALQRRSLALSERLYGADSGEAALAAAELGKVLLEMNQRDEASALLLRAAKIVDAVRPVDTGLSVFVYTTLAFMHVNGDSVQALSWARRAAALARHQPPSADTIGALQLLGETSYKVGSLGEARQAFLAAQAQIASRPELASGVLPLVLASLGSVHSRLGNPAAASTTLQSALDIATRMSDPYTLHAVIHKMLVCEHDNGLYDTGVKRAASAYEWARTAGADFGPLPVLLAADYAQALIDVGDPAQALEVLETFEGRLDGLPPDLLGGVLAIRASARMASGRVAEAGPDLERAVGLAGTLGGSAADIRRARRTGWLASGQAERALRDFGEESAPVLPEAGPLLAARRQLEEANLLWAAGREQAALDLARQALVQIEASPERRFARPAEATGAEIVGRALVRRGRAADAIPPLERAVALRRELHGSPNSPQLAAALRALGEARSAGAEAAPARGG